MEKIFGINLNTDHIGWVVRDNNKILGNGVRMFEVPETPKEKDTLASVRRLKRSARRRIRRKSTRMKAVKRLIFRHKLLTEKELTNIFTNKDAKTDIYTLRYEGLDRVLSNIEWARVLIHLAKHRGYKSTSKEERLKETQILNSDKVKVTNDDETGKVLIALKENETIFNANNYRTVGEMIYTSEKFAAKKRNEANVYDRIIHRKFIEQEIRTLFESQRKLGNEFTSKEFEDKYLEYSMYQKPYATRQLLESMVSNCTLIKGEKRYAKGTYSFERFSFIQKLNSLKIEDRFLNNDERSEIVELAYRNKKVTYTQIRKILAITEDEKFNLITYGDQKLSKVEGTEFISLKVYHSLKDAISKVSEEVWNELSKNIDLLDKIGYELTVCKSDEELKEYLLPYIDEVVFDSIKTLNFNGFGHISKKAIDKILPYLENGNQYTNACYNAGVDSNGYAAVQEITTKFPVIPLSEINNTKAHRILSQFRKVYNALVDRYGVPTEVVITIAREVSMSGIDKNKLIREAKVAEIENEKNKEEFFKEFGINGTSKDLLKYKLWKEQEGQCIYSGEKILLKNLLDEEYIVDNILDVRISLKNSNTNNVLIKRSEFVEDKALKTPFEIFGEDQVKWESFIERIKSLKDMAYLKKGFLMKRTITKNDVQGFRERHLMDNSSVSSMIGNCIKNNLKGETDSFSIRIVNESLVNFLRKEWRLPKNKKYVYSKCIDSYILTACTTQFIKSLKSNSKEVFEGADIPTKDYFSMPYNYFKEEILARISNNPNEKLRKMVNKYNIQENYTYNFIETIKPIIPSIKAERSINGQIHPETIRSLKYVKVPLNKLNFKNIGYNKETKIAENIYNWYSDKMTYDAIVNRLVEFDGNGAKAFTEPFYKISNKGVGQEIKGLKLITSYTGVKVNQGITDSAPQLRLDLFNSPKRIMFVPIYRYNTRSAELPNRAITSGKKECDWTVVNEEDFMVSLYSKDAVLITFGDSVKPLLCHYVGVDRSSGAAKFNVFEDGMLEERRFGASNISKINKVEVGILGDINIIKKKQERQGYTIKGYKHKSKK